MCYHVFIIVEIMMFPQIMVKTKHVVAKTLIFMGQLPKFHRLKPIFLEHFCQANSQPLHSIPGKPAVPANQHLRKSCICFNEYLNVLCVCKKTLNMCKFCPILPSFPPNKTGSSKPRIPWIWCFIPAAWPYKVP